MKGQTDARAGLDRANREARDQLANRGAADEQRKAEVASLVKDYHRLVKENKFLEAEKVAMQAKQLDPDNPAIGALAEMAKMSRPVHDSQMIKDNHERIFREGRNAAERQGPFVDTGTPLSIDLDAMRRSRGRGTADAFIRSRSPAEYEIELKLDKPISIEFSQVPLEQAIKNLQEITKLPLVIDQSSLDAEGISAVKPITVAPGMPVATRHILSFLLE